LTWTQIFSGASPKEAPMRMLVPPGQYSTNPNLHQAGTTE
jgi:hypothetical protein